MPRLLNNLGTKCSRMNTSQVHSISNVSGTHNRTGVPIFIMGIMPRSGTNFLHRLLCQHPDCGAINTTPVREDYVLHHGYWLSTYTKRLRWQWGHWGADSDFVAPLSTNLGVGISDFLATLTDAKRFVTKTPSVSNIESFFEFFPHAQLLVIVRDGRSVVASGMSGFGWNFETASREWGKAARNILSFEEKNHRFKDRFKIVTYESLNANTVDSLQDIFQFLELDPGQYDFEAALDTPIYGSSYMKEEGQKVTWAPKEKSNEIVGGNRWDDWSNFEHQRFNKLAGKELTQLGYEPVEQSISAFGVMRHIFVDSSENAKRTARQLMQAAKVGARSFRKEFGGESHSKVNLKK